MSTIDREWLFDLLGRLAEGVVAVVGPHCEVEVHDFTDLEHSIVAIAGNLTGRRPGAPVPDVDFIAQGLNADQPDGFNYRYKIGLRTLQASTIWVRDPDGTPLGAVSINLDNSNLQRARELLDLMSISTQTVSNYVIEDNTFAHDLDELIRNAINSYLRESGLPGTVDLSPADKLRLVERLEERGLFQIRGAAQKVADLLGISRASVYKYRSTLKEDNPDTQAKPLPFSGK